MRPAPAPSGPIVKEIDACGLQCPGPILQLKQAMDLMGIKREELIDGVEEGGVAAYLDRAGSANVNLFIG